MTELVLLYLIILVLLLLLAQVSENYYGSPGPGTCAMLSPIGDDISIGNPASWSNNQKPMYYTNADKGRCMCWKS